METITITPPNLLIRIKAAPAPSASGTALFFIGVSYTHPSLHDGRIRMVRDYSPWDTIYFRFDGYLRRSQLQTVADSILSLTNSPDTILFQEYFLGSIAGYCNRATSVYHQHMVEFQVSVESPGPAALQEMGASYRVLILDDVIPYDVWVGTWQSGSNRAIERLERIKVAATSDQCSICLEEFGRENDLDLGKTPCSHVFHYRCVRQWLGWKPTCPLCRSDISG